MTGQTSVVSPERFASGLAYQDYIAGINVNKDRFEQYYETGTISDEDAEFFRKAVQHPKGPAKMLVLGEDWCPDVYRGMPLMARLAEASGMEMRVFPRDQHLDIMDEFLKEGEFRSVPTVVFYTRDHDYITHWIERPKFANEDRDRINQAIRGELAGASDDDLRAETRKRTTERFPVWQQESIKEIRQQLAEKLGME